MMIARTPWEQILWDLFYMQRDIALAQRHTPGTGYNK